MDIKEFLEIGGIISIPYVKDIDSPEWDNIKLRKSDMLGKYVISADNDIDKRVVDENFDEIFSKYSEYFNNVGILMIQVMKENPDIEPDYSEDDLNLLKKLIKEKQNTLSGGK